jgi:hypothetical protein
MEIILKKRYRAERRGPRATKLMKSFKDENYKIRLKKLRLTTMKTRRLRGNLTEVFKVFKGMDNLDVDKFFS